MPAVGTYADPMPQYFGVREDLGFRYVRSYVLPFPEWPVLVHASETAFIPGHRGEEHLHHALELTYVVSGRGERFVNGHAHPLGPHDYHVVAGGELHASRSDRRDPFRYITLGLRIDQLPSATDVQVAEALARVRPLSARVVRGGAGGERGFRRLIAELGLAEREPRFRPLRLLMVQSLVTEIVARFARQVLDADPPADEEPEPVRPPLQELLAWMATRLRRPPRIAEMAQRMQLSPGHFIASFRRACGRTPKAHIAALRLAEASRRLISTEDRVARIAEDLGFCSSRYFSQVFRRARGISPSAWRERHRS